MINDDRLASAVRALGDSGDTGEPPVDALEHRGRRSVRNHRIGRSAALGAVAVLGIVSLAVGTVGHAPDTGTADSARVRLVDAAQTTDADTFRFATENAATAIKYGHELSGSQSCTGAVDLQQSAGYLVFPNGDESRVIGDDVYDYSKWDGIWVHHVSKPGSAIENLGCGSVVTKSADPNAILEPIKENGTVEYKGRHNGVDIYWFDYTRPWWDYGESKVHVVGTVKVDGATNLVKEVVEDGTFSFEGKVHGTEKSTTTYSGYGDPVTVEPPSGVE